MLRVLCCLRHAEASHVSMQVVAQSTFPNLPIFGHHSCKHQWLLLSSLFDRLLIKVQCVVVALTNQRPMFNDLVDVTSAGLLSVLTALRFERHTKGTFE
jgi:hypothetical protein